MPSVKREPMQLTEEELLVESDEDLEIGASLSVGLDDRNRMVVQLEYVYYDDHRRDNTLYALLDQEETTTLADRLTFRPPSCRQRCASISTTIPSFRLPPM